MRGLMLGGVIALAFYGLCDLALRGSDRFRVWWSVRRRRRSLRLAKRLLAPERAPFPWVLVVSLSLIIVGMAALAMAYPTSEVMPPLAAERPGEEIRFQQPPVDRAQVAPGQVMHMVATRYHEKYAGRTTASGELYDPTLHTAAHRTLPFGATVQVLGPDGPDEVRINDRGPWCEHGPTCTRPCPRADIDLSEAAARKVGTYEAGRAWVRVWRRL